MAPWQKGGDGSRKDAAWHVVGGSEGEGECSLFLSETVNGNRLEALSY